MSLSCRFPPLAAALDMASQASSIFSVGPGKKAPEEVFSLVNDESLEVIDGEEVYLPVRKSEGSFFYGH
eukprot:scaffold2088_cov399-Prasinococcus_capsulatus_cf.AAC.38